MYYVITIAVLIVWATIWYFMGQVMGLWALPLGVAASYPASVYIRRLTRYIR